MTEKFKTSRGIELEFLPIQTLLDKLNAQYQASLPEPPYYEVKTATGVTEKHEHDETTVTTDEEKAALAKYREDWRAAQNANNERLTRLILMRGVKVDMPQDDAWVKEQEFLGITVPTDSLERRLHWISTEAIAGVEDIEAIMLGVMRASGVSEELLKSVEATFRRSLGQSERNETQRPTAKEDWADVVLQSEV